MFDFTQITTMIVIKHTDLRTETGETQLTRGPSVRWEGKEMKRMHKILAATLCLAAVGVVVGATANAQEKAKTTSILTFWALPKEGSAITVLELGVDAQKTLAVNPVTVFDGMCEHCMLPIKFKAADSGKNCQPCGCAVSNAECVAGKPIKGTWQAMFTGLPKGVGLRPVYNEADKPESGLKIVYVDRHIVFLPVDGMSAVTPDQIAALVKSIGGAKPEILNGGKHLTFTMKEEWVHDTEVKFVKALAKIGGKISQPEKVASAQ